MTKTRRIFAAAAVATLLIPFQNCGSKTDLGSYGVTQTSTGNSSSASIKSISSPVTVDAMDSTAISVVASGPEPMTYQWFKDGVAVAGQTKPIMAIVEALPNPIGDASSISNYSVRVTDANGVSVTSSNIPVTVQRTAAQAAPVISGFTMAGAPSTGYTRPNCTVPDQSSLKIGVVATGVGLTYAWKLTYNRGNGSTYTDLLSTTSAVLTPPLIPVYNNSTIVNCRIIYFGTYTVTVTDAFGRTATADYTVN